MSDLPDALIYQKKRITERNVEYEKKNYSTYYLGEYVPPLSEHRHKVWSAQKTMNKQGSMKVINVGEEIMEIFEITGFTDILTIE